MEVIRLSQEQFNNLKPISLPKEVFNSESDVYELDHLGEKKVLKTIFTPNEELYKNKLYTINKLNEHKDILPRSFCIPDYLTTIDGEIFGFTTPHYPGINLATILKNTKLPIEEHLYYLKLIGNLLNELKNIRQNSELKDIYINDLHESNFIVNPFKKEIGVVDLDSCKIGNNYSFVARYLSPFSIIAEVDKKYIKKNGITSGPGYIKADENTDIYCYIMLILNYFTNGFISRFSLQRFNDYLNFLNELKINKELLDIIELIIKQEPNLNPVDYLDTLSEKQITEIKENTKKFLKIK